MHGSEGGTGSNPLTYPTSLPAKVGNATYTNRSLQLKEQPWIYEKC